MNEVLFPAEKQVNQSAHPHHLYLCPGWHVLGLGRNSISIRWNVQNKPALWFLMNALVFWVLFMWALFMTEGRFTSGQCLFPLQFPFLSEGAFLSDILSLFLFPLQVHLTIWTIIWFITQKKPSYRENHLEPSYLFSRHWERFPGERNEKTEPLMMICGSFLLSLEIRILLAFETIEW